MLVKEGAHTLYQCGVFMKDSADGFTHSKDLGAKDSVCCSLQTRQSFILQVLQSFCDTAPRKLVNPLSVQLVPLLGNVVIYSSELG